MTAKMQPIRIAIIEDHIDFSESVTYLLKSTDGFRPMGQYISVEEALKKMPASDVVLLDINLPGMSGIEGLSRLKEKFPETKIIILTVFEDSRNIFRGILAGADGYLLKKTPPVRILQSIEDVMAGGAPMTPVVAKQALAIFKEYAPKIGSEDVLTSREQEILQLLVKGLATKAIATKLSISHATVRNHIRHIYEKLHVHSKSQAVVKALQEGLL
jgi:DNA-binding NarL/FixJ family response regulator